MACVRERLGKGDIEGASKAHAKAALEFEEAKENRDAELAVLSSSCLSALVGAMTYFSSGVQSLYVSRDSMQCAFV